MSTKTNADYLREGIELAKGWDITHIFAGEDVAAYNPKGKKHPEISFVLQYPNQSGKAILAAQLVRQVDNMHEFQVVSYKYTSYVECCGVDPRPVIAQVSYRGRSMNTIRAVVDSKVLKT